MRTVLLAGFEPFGGDAVNPSAEAVQRVGAHWNGPENLVTMVLPVTFYGAPATLLRAIEEHDPDVVIAVGLAGGRSAIGVERVALNLADARIPDNSGDQPIDEPSVAGAPSALFTSLPAKAIVRAIEAAGIRCELSLSAGTFVCNHVFFHTAAWALDHNRRGGFLHVPWATGQAPAGEPELALTDIAEGIRIAVRTTLDRAEIHVAGGTLH